MAKKGAEFAPRTNFSQDGVPNPLPSELLKKASEVFFGKLEIVPKYLTELPYQTGQEHFVVDLLTQERKLSINKAIKEATKPPAKGDNFQDNIAAKLSETVTKSVDDISDRAGVGSEKSRNMQIDRETLEAWIRSSTVLSLVRESYGKEYLDNDICETVATRLLKDQAPDKWKKWKNRAGLSKALTNGEEGLIKYLQSYVDAFSSK